MRPSSIFRPAPSACSQLPLFLSVRSVVHPPHSDYASGLMQDEMLRDCDGIFTDVAKTKKLVMSECLEQAGMRSLLMAMLSSGLVPTKVCRACLQTREEINIALPVTCLPQRGAYARRDGYVIFWDLGLDAALGRQRIHRSAKSTAGP